MDRNTVIGFILLGALLIGMFVINSRSRLAYEAEQKRIADSIALLQPKPDTTLARLDSLKTDSLIARQQQSSFTTTAGVSETSVENEVMKVRFSNKGAVPVFISLKKYSKLNGDPVVVLSGDFNSMGYLVNSGNNSTVETSKLVFSPGVVTNNPDKSTTVTFEAADPGGRKIVHSYTIRPSDYMMDFNITLNGSDRLFTNNVLNLVWQAEAPQIESDYKYEATQTHITYFEDGDFDFEYLGTGDDINFKKPVSWIGVKQQFFAGILLAKNRFQGAKTSWTVPSDTNQHYIARATTTARVDLTPGTVSTIPLQLYYGPTDYNILKKYNNELESIVPYGSGVFAFVKYINRHILLPVFDFLQKHVASMGIVVLLLTLFIRLITSPILYKSYLSGAKMKVLKPEVDALRAKHTDPRTKQMDQQAFSMDQMKLWRSAGVSPLGGCLPALLQIPIFMSLYYFFQSNIDLRGKSFLWADDLATYDSIATLPFEIPFYGDHVSLFTLTATITSLLISLYSMANMQDNTNPLMKYMPYIFPVLLLFIFNSLPAALTWYYTVSNVITLILQFIIQRYIIDHKKIHAQIAEKMKQPVKKSKLQERIEAMQEQQKKIQAMKAKGK